MISPDFQVMLSAKYNEAALRKFLAGGNTLLQSVKLDGIRVYGHQGKAFTRSNKLVPNKHIQEIFANGRYDGWDGELATGSLFDGGTYSRSFSAIMSDEGDIAGTHLYVFDNVYRLEAPHNLRMYGFMEDSFSSLVEQHKVSSIEKVLESQETFLGIGAEGVMYRDGNRPYKMGRSTARELALMKFKPEEDAEFVVEGFEEAMHNDNEAFVNELGRTDRSSHAENKRPAGRVGAFLTTFNGKPLRIATGNFKHHELVEIWQNQEKYRGRLIVARVFKYGMKDLPRHPRAKGWRDTRDL